jgi:transcriptional regulator with XRE-family HTH domain
MSSLAQRLRHYRKQSGITQEAAADALGIRSVNYAKYESGERNPREDKLLALSNLFGVSYQGLSEGVERSFLGLLHAHMQGAVLNNADRFCAFNCDVLGDTEAFPFIKDCFDKWREVCREKWADWYVKYLEEPTLPKLVFLGEKLSKHGNAIYEQDSDNRNRMKCPAPQRGVFAERKFREAVVAKLVFCIAVTDFLGSTDSASIIRKSEETMGGCAVISPLQFFAVKVFVPYLSILSEAVELTANTFISDFETAFLYGALTPRSDENNISAEVQHRE